MNEKSIKLVQWLLYALMGVSALLTVVFYMNPSNPDLMLYWGYALFIISLGIVLAVSVMALIKNPKGSFKVLLVLAGMIVLGIIAYSVSDSNLTPQQLEKYKITAGQVKLVGAGLIMTCMIMAIAIGVFIYTSLARFIKK